MNQLSDYRQDLKAQIKDAYGKVVYTYTTHLKQIEKLRRKNMQIKYLQIALSAISTGGFLASVITSEIVLTWIGGSMSTALLAVNLYYKEFDLSEDIRRHRVTADELWIIKEKTISLLTDFPTLSEQEIVEVRNKIQVKLSEIYHDAPTTDRKSYLAAQKALQQEEEQFFNKGEIDTLLPEHLRELS